jgi:beta-glucosidase
MTGKYNIQTEKGTLLFDISKNEDRLKVNVQMLEFDSPLKPTDVQTEGQTIMLTSNFFMTPQIKHKLELKYLAEENCYEVDGSYAIAGKLKGKAVLFTGKTKYDLMLEELPLKRTCKIVKRSNEEIAIEVNKLMKQMTLEEKIGQMTQSGGINTAAIGGDINQTMTIEEMIVKGLIGSTIAILSTESIFEQQKLAVEKSRLGIPLMFCQDVIHGAQTIFPIPLGWSCSFDPELVGRAGRVAAKESTAVGIMYAFAPMLDIARDPRWGRVSEGNGEDPYLCARICEAQVKGYQGEDLTDDDSMIACLKHFVGYSAAEAGRDYNTCEITETTLRNIYLEPFRAGIEAGAGSVMNSFNTMNGIPIGVNKYMLRDVLRDELGFNGIVISDYAAIQECITHGAAEDDYDAAIKAVIASMDIEMATSLYNSNLKNAVACGKLDLAFIDESVTRILTYKYKTGLMDDPYKYLQPEKSNAIFCDEYQQISKELARESIVLLKNDGVLPIPKMKKVALIGPKGRSKDLLGPWQFSLYSDETITLEQGLKSMGYELIHEEGSQIVNAIEGGIERAIKVANEADVVILALGEDMHMSGEAASRQNITIPDCQMELAYAIKELGKEIVLVLTNGRPLILEWFEENANAIVETWFLGSQAGNAIADVLSGEYNPSGKLSITFPRNQGQIPIYYNHLSTGRPYVEGSPNKFLSKYIDGSNAPRYNFGYGLSYTTFQISDLILSDNIIKDNTVIKVSVTVQNTGDRAGTEVIQLYLRDIAASIARPVKELKGFERITLEPGEKKMIIFHITESMLAFYNFENKKVSEAGKFTVMVGNSSRDEDLLQAGFTLIK